MSLELERLRCEVKVNEIASEKEVLLKEEEKKKKKQKRKRRKGN